jgi:hypothetical protein
MNRSGTQEISHIFLGTITLLQHSKEHTTCFCPEIDEASSSQSITSSQKKHKFPLKKKDQLINAMKINYRCLR